MRAEIELPNKDGRLRPGMYVHARIIKQLKKGWTIETAAVMKQGDAVVCFLIEDGKAVRTPVQTGVSDGSWVEVTGKLAQSAGSSEETWVAFDGAEAVIDGDLSGISDGQPVKVDPGN